MKYKLLILIVFINACMVDEQRKIPTQDWTLDSEQFQCSEGSDPSRCALTRCLEVSLGKYKQTMAVKNICDDMLFFNLKKDSLEGTQIVTDKNVPYELLHQNKQVTFDAPDISLFGIDLSPSGKSIKLRPDYFIFVKLPIPCDSKDVFKYCDGSQAPEQLKLEYNIHFPLPALEENTDYVDYESCNSICGQPNNCSRIKNTWNIKGVISYDVTNPKECPAYPRRN